MIFKNVFKFLFLPFPQVSDKAWDICKMNSLFLWHSECSWKSFHSKEFLVFLQILCKFLPIFIFLICFPCYFHNNLMLRCFQFLGLKYFRRLFYFRGFILFQVRYSISVLSNMGLFCWGGYSISWHRQSQHQPDTNKFYANWDFHFHAGAFKYCGCWWCGNDHNYCSLKM